MEDLDFVATDFVDFSTISPQVYSIRHRFYIARATENIVHHSSDRNIEF
jgi:hypothetical protein